jgi:MFS family permease
MLIYIAGFAISLGPIMWLIISEIFPLEIRGFASSLMVSASWMFNALVALTFLTLIQKLGQTGTFLIYGVICFFGILFIFFKVPETKGTSLEQIENNLRAGVRSVDLGSKSI